MEEGSTRGLRFCTTACGTEGFEFERFAVQKVLQGGGGLGAI